MKKYVYGFGIFSLALLMGWLPPAVFAAQRAIVFPSSNTPSSGSKDIQNGTTTAVAQQEDDESMEDQQNEQKEEQIHFQLENDTLLPAHSLNELKQIISVRENQLTQEVGSTTPADRLFFEDAKPIRLAVRSLMASRELLGSVGQQVSEIAQQVNGSVLATTNAEATIHARTPLERFFFGGDSAAGAILQEETIQNQQFIGDIVTIIAKDAVSPEVKATLMAQITAMQDEQTRLLHLGQKEQKAWGLFSWRF